MAKELPYFKFHVSEWSDGDITLEDYEVQGFFISLCAYYWSNRCLVEHKKALKKFKDVKVELWETLTESEIVKIDKKGMLSISFLNEQWEERNGLCNQNAINAKKGWERRKSEAERKQSESNRNAAASNPQSESDAESMQYREEKKREEKKREEEINNLYNLYPSQTLRKGKKCSTRSKEKNLNKLKNLLSKKEHTFETLKTAIEAEVKSKNLVNGIPEYLKDFNTFLNNLPDIEYQEPVINENLITYRWHDEQHKRTIEKDKAERYFASMAEGGYKAIIIN